MKTLSFLSLIIVFFPFAYNPLLKSDKVNRQKQIRQDEKAKILKIDSIDNVYIIYAKKRDSIFKVISLKSIENNNCKQIKKGKYYNLHFVSYFKKNFHQKRDISYVRLGETLIKLEGNGVIWDIFISENLNGLCYIK